MEPTSALETYLPLAQFGAFFSGWVVAMITGLFFSKVQS